MNYNLTITYTLKLDCIEKDCNYLVGKRHFTTMLFVPFLNMRVNFCMYVIPQT